MEEPSNAPTYWPYLVWESEVKKTKNSVTVGQWGVKTNGWWHSGKGKKKLLEISQSFFYAVGSSVARLKKLSRDYCTGPIFVK